MTKAKQQEIVDALKRLTAFAETHRFPEPIFNMILMGLLCLVFGSRIRAVLWVLYDWWQNSRLNPFYLRDKFEYPEPTEEENLAKKRHNNR